MPADRQPIALSSVGKADRSDAALAGAGLGLAGGITAVAAQGTRNARRADVRLAEHHAGVAQRDRAQWAPVHAQSAKDAQARYDALNAERTPKGYPRRGEAFRAEAARALADRDVAARKGGDLVRRVGDATENVRSARGKVKAPTRLRNVGLIVAGLGSGIAAGSVISSERKRKRKPKPAPALRELKRDKERPARPHGLDAVPDRVDPKLFDSDPRYKKPAVYPGYQT